MSVPCVSFRCLYVRLVAILVACAFFANTDVMAQEKATKGRKAKEAKTEKKVEGEEKEKAQDKVEKVVIEDEAALLTVLNKADAKALGAIRGVGKKLAVNIIAARPFKTLDDLLKVEGIAQKRFEKIKSSIGTVKVPASVFAEDEE